MTAAPQRNRVIVIAVLAVIVVALLAAAFWAYTQDDVFITYVYSRNIAHGQGFVFNPGERVQGSTTPLYALLMAGVSLLTPDLLHAGNLLSALLLLAACALAFDLTREELSIYARVALILILITSPLVYVSFGMETLLYTALLMLAFWLWQRERRGWAMLVAAALTWTRADGIVMGGTLGLLALADTWRSRPAGAPMPRLRDLPWKEGVIYLLGIAPWFVFAALYFGTPLPNTFSAKQEILHGVKFWTDGWGWWRSFYGNNWLSLLAAPLIGLGVWRVWMHPRLRPIALWAVLYALGYTVLNVTAFWYYTPLFAVMVLLAAFGGEWLARQLVARATDRRFVAAGAAVIVLGSAALATAQALKYGNPPPRVDTYRDVGQWIDANTPADSTLLLGDLGIVGYYAQRHTMDVPGLITPEMHIKHEGYAVAKFRPDLVVATQYWTWVNLVEQDWFHQYYAPLVQISAAGDAFSPIAIYRRTLPLTTPAEAVQGFDLPLTCTVALQPGDALPVEIHARLLAPTGGVLAEVAHPFFEGQYPDPEAQARETLIDQIALPLDVPPGRYTWELNCDTTQQGQVDVVPVTQDKDYTPVSGAQWDDLAQLSGVIYRDGLQTWSGGSLALALDWRALGPGQTDYNVFIHLLELVGPACRAGRRPTAWWCASGHRLAARRHHRRRAPPAAPPRPACRRLSTCGRLVRLAQRRPPAALGRQRRFHAARRGP